MRVAATIPIRCAPPFWRSAPVPMASRAHLREDRRHISDEDIARLSKALTIPLNLEMAATDEMAAIALEAQATCRLHCAGEARGAHHRGRDRCCMASSIVSAPIVVELAKAGIRVSMFIEPNPIQLDASKALGAPVVELHTGAYAHAGGAEARALRESVTLPV